MYHKKELEDKLVFWKLNSLFVIDYEYCACWYTFLIPLHQCMSLSTLWGMWCLKCCNQCQSSTKRGCLVYVYSCMGLLNKKYEYYPTQYIIPVRECRVSRLDSGQNRTGTCTHPFWKQNRVGPKYFRQNLDIANAQSCAILTGHLATNWQSA